MFCKMRTHIREIILCLLCVACILTVLSKEITEFRIASSKSVENISSSSKVQKNNETNLRSTDKLRDKRALGIILSGLAQIFGYNVTPIQIASLPNSDTTISTAASNSSIFTIARQIASPTVLSTNTTIPRQQETIKFTGVVNFGNNSDILGHLQRYEQIFHGNKTATGSFLTTSRPILTSSSDTLLDPRTPIKPPLLAPFFVKIPLPIAPNLIPPTLSIGNFKSSYSTSPISILNESQKDDEIPIHKEQETIYRNNEDTEQYSLEEKDIYDDMNVRIPVSKYIHQLNVDEPSWRNQQIDNYELQRKQQEYIEKLKTQEKEKNHDNNDDNYRENQDNERHGNREEQESRNQDDPKHKLTDEKNPTYNDEEDDGSTEKYQKYAGQINVPKEFSKQEATESDERKKEQDYSKDDDGDVPNKYSNNQPDEKPLVNFNKYIESGYNQQLPIGDYFYGHNSEEIRDSYGEVLENKKLNDDRLSSYFGMFKHPHTGMYDPQKIINSENDKQTPPSNNYNEDLNRVQKFNEEYTPQNKYEEYDINEEDEAHQENGKIEETQNLNSNLTAEEFENDRTATNSESQYDNKDEVTKSENTKLQGEIDFMQYTPLIVPVRYVYANDKIKGKTAKYSRKDKSDNFGDSEVRQDDTMLTESKENQVIPRIGIPERPRKLHESEYKQYIQISPSPFDYIYDDTKQVNAIIPKNLQDHTSNYDQYVVMNSAITTNNNFSKEYPGFVLDNRVYPFRNPYNIYYISKEASDQFNGDPYINTYSNGHFPAQNTNQQYVQENLNINQYRSGEALTQPYYYQFQKDNPNIFDQSRYTFDEHIPKPSTTIDVKKQILNTEDSSGRIYPSQSHANIINQFSPNLVQVQNIEPSNQNTQSESSNNQRYLESSRGHQYFLSGNKNVDNRDIKNLTSQFRKYFDNSTENSHEFTKEDYDFGSKNNDTSKVAQENV